MKIRPAVPEDAAAIAYVQKMTWQRAYRGIVPQPYLDSMMTPEWQQERTERWQSGLVNPASLSCVSEAASGEVTGFVSGGACRDVDTLPEVYAGEVYALYLLPEYHGQGIGRGLLAAFGQRLVQADYTSMLLWVLKDNQPARGFYEKMGGQWVAEKPLTIGGVDLLEVAYGWRDVNRLIRPE